MSARCDSEMLSGRTICSLGGLIERTQARTQHGDMKAAGRRLSVHVLVSVSVSVSVPVSVHVSVYVYVSVSVCVCERENTNQG